MQKKKKKKQISLGFKLPRKSTHSPHSKPVLLPLIIIQAASLRVRRHGGRQRRVPFLRVTPHFLGPSNISWGCRRHFSLCQEPDFREAESGQRDHNGRGLWLLLDGACSGGLGSGGGFDYCLGRKQGILFLGFKDALATENYTISVGEGVS